MRALTERERQKLLEAGEICYKEFMQEIEREIEQDIAQAKIQSIDYDRDKLRRAEQQAWQELRKSQRKHLFIRKRNLILFAVFLLMLVSIVFLIDEPTVAYQNFVNNHFIKNNDTTISIRSSSTALVPDNWSGKYAPTRIPQGYVIEKVEDLQYVQSIFYVNEAGDYIDFSVFFDEANTDLDGEECVVEEIKVGKKNGIVQIKIVGDEVIFRAISWQEEDLFFDITSNNLSKEILLSIAESVMQVE